MNKGKRIDQDGPKLYPSYGLAKKDAHELQRGDPEWRYVVRSKHLNQEGPPYYIDVYDNNLDYVGHWS
jgi:hypothetical protein